MIGQSHLKWLKKSVERSNLKGLKKSVEKSNIKGLKKIIWRFQQFQTRYNEVWSKLELRSVSNENSFAKNNDWNWANSD